MKRILSGMALLAAASVWAAEPEPLAVFECRDELQREWPRTLVTYQLDSRKGSLATEGRVGLSRALKADGVKLVNADTGAEAPFQLWREKKNRNGTLESARLSFFASLSPGGRYRYELRPGAPARDPEKPALLPSAVPLDGFLQLDNGLVAIRLPAPGERAFSAPAPFVEGGAAPGPFQGLRLADGNWTGGSFFQSPDPARAPRVTGYTCRITEQGPLFVEASIRYTFSNKGWYEWTARVLADDPAVRIDEQFDMGEPGEPDYRLMVSLGANWRPDTVYWYGPRLSGAAPGFTNRLAALGLTNEVEHGSRALAGATGELFRVAVRYPWAPNAFLFGLAGMAGEKPPFLGVVPLHAGNWRGSVDASDGAVLAGPDGGVLLSWRLRASPHPMTVLHTGEYDPDLPLTHCRRQWALVGGAFQGPGRLHAFRRTEGFVTLDDVKDWVADWPADRKVTYPRLVFGRRDVERLKPKLDQAPGADVLRQFLYFNETDARREELWKTLTADSEWSGPYGMARSILGRGDPPGMPWATHFRLAQMAGWAGRMDELLSSTNLTAQQRGRLRRDLALLCHVLAEPDINPRGALTHLGNPNMPINRFMALPFAAALIPDHPMADAWLDISARYLRYKLAMNTAPGGAWSELITYFGASAPHLMQAAAVLAASGRGDEATVRLSAMPALFTLRLLTPPDPRFAGARKLPNWGHEGADTLTHWLVAAANIREEDPVLARDLAWAWDRQGRPMNQHHDAGFSERAVMHADLLNGLPGSYVPESLASAWLPGFGATMRAHPGASNETYLSFRQGYMTSHSDPNQGDFVLYAKGAPLVSLSLHAYPLHQLPEVQELDRTFGWHSRVRFGTPGNAGGWPGGGALGGVPFHSFGPSVDYLCAVGEYPAGTQDNAGAAQQWTRRIALLKSRTDQAPNVVVMRDSFDSAGERVPTWWTLRTLGARTQVRPEEHGFVYESPFGPRLTARFLQPATVPLESRDVSFETPLYFGTARMWLQSGLPAKSNNADNITIRDTLTINRAGPVPAGEDVLAVLVPQEKDDVPPRIESVAEGVARVVTAEGSDTVFLGRGAMSFNNGDYTFEGTSGVVRVYPDEIHLILCEGGGRIGYKGTTLSAAGPAERRVPAGRLAQPQALTAPPEKGRIKRNVLPKDARVSGDARCEIAYEGDRIKGRSEGNGGFLYAPMPAGLKVLPELVVDGMGYAPGTSSNTLIIPLMPGSHAFEVRPLEQPPIFRNWQAW